MSQIFHVVLNIYLKFKFNRVSSTIFGTYDNLTHEFIFLPSESRGWNCMVFSPHG